MVINYDELLRDALGRYKELSRQREEIETEQTKLLQFVMATIPLLPEATQKAMKEALDAITEEESSRTENLTQAIRRVLRNSWREWLSTTEVRDKMIQNGFDFSGYASNPLASISTTLRRIHQKEDSQVESKTMEGVTVYRWNGPYPILAPPDVGLAKPESKNLMAKHLGSLYTRNLLRPVKGKE